MNTNKIRSTIAERAQAAGLDPSGPLGYADLLGFGKRYNSKGRVGLLGVPDGVVDDKEAFFGNPVAQIDAGIELMRQAKEQGGDDFSALMSYTGDPSTTVRSMIRGTKYSGQPLSASMIAQAAQAAGATDIDPEAEAKKAGIELQPEPQVQEPLQTEMPPGAPIDQGPGMIEEPEIIDEPMTQSTEDQRKLRLQQAFGAKGKTSGLSDELNTFLGKIL